MRRQLVPAGVAVALALFAGAAWANGDFCSSQEFREAFLDNQQNIPFDWLDVSRKLVAFGDQAVPCLTTIAENGGQEYDISDSECIEGPDGCAVWAVRAISDIGTPEAKRNLVAFLRKDVGGQPLVAALSMLRVHGVTSIRPELLGLLKHPEPQVRAESIVTLGVLGEPADFTVMLEATLGLPDKQIYRGARGLELFGDPRAIEPLAERARSVQLPIEREQLEKRIEKMRSESEGSPKPSER